MAVSSSTKGSVPVEVRASFSERPADLPPIAAYAFTRGGALLDMQPLDDKGHARLSLPASAEPQAIRVLLAPSVDRDAAEVGELVRRGGIDRHVALRPGIDTLPPIAFEIGTDLLRPWLGRLCVVKGTLVKQVVSGGVTLRLPVCHAKVDIYEVDPWPRIIVTLPDLELDRLRDIVDGPWPPIKWPVPPRPPELDFGDAIRDPLGAVGLNPQPLPPRAVGRQVLHPGYIRGFDPQPEPPAAARQALTSLPAALSVAVRASRPQFERAVIDHIDLLRPVLCWLYPRLVRKTKLVTVSTDDCGHCRAVIWRSIFDLDQPDLYFIARQRIWPGFYVNIYEPTPVACHTYWNYVCGTEVTLVTRHPLAHACPPCPPVVAPNNWVLFMALGNTSVWGIHGVNAATAVGAPGHQASRYGLLQDTNPWGGTLRPRLEFDNSLRDTLGVKYYRVSYKRQSEPQTAWRPSTDAVNRHYTHEVAGDLILEQYPLGPSSVGASAHLYEIPPALPPTGQWSIPNAVLDTQSAVVPTGAVAPGVDFNSAGLPSGPDEGGLWQIKVELFNAAGVQIDPEALGITWRVPDTADLSGTIGTEDAATLGLVDAARNCMVITVRVDNNPCAAGIGSPTLDGSPAADACGVMDYTSRSQTVTTPFVALQRNGFATYSFFVQRGAVTPPEVTVSGTAATSAPAMPPAPTETVGGLLDSCNTAGFTENLYVAHLATDGWSRQSQHDRSAVRAFVLAPVQP